jgi:LAO/AO transport system kinase
LTGIADLVEAAAGGERHALARLLSIAERGDARVLEIEDLIAPLVGQAWVIGITGPPGAGKSTLINGLLPLAQKAEGRAAVVAVDPSSPFSDGAILGDRVRMQGGQYGADVFIRSMASRGEAGGLARAASTSVRLFDAAGWPVVIIETLGIGQVELDIMNLADTVLVVLNPGWGDSFQANKAGLTEAADIFVINKADREGVQQTRKDLLDSLSLLPSGHRPPILATVATTGEGMEDLWSAIEDHRARIASNGNLQALRDTRRRRIVRKTIREQLTHVVDELLDSAAAEELLAGATLGELEISSTVQKLLAMMAASPGYRQPP